MTLASTSISRQRRVSILQKYDYDILALALPLPELTFQFYRSTIMTGGGKCDKKGAPQFQFYRSTIMTKQRTVGTAVKRVSILQKYDYDRGEKNKMFTFLHRFNSTEVRLWPEYFFADHATVVVSILQKYDYDSYTSPYHSSSSVCFNSTEVRLWRGSEYTNNLYCLFQFYRSTIMTSKMRRKMMRAWLVSILQKYDYDLMRLTVAKIAV